MSRNLSVRQLKFAAAVAAGKSQVEAYKEAGYAPNGKRETAQRDAKKLARKAEVRASIEKMRRQLLPDPGDVRDIRTHAMAVIVGLSLDAEEEKVRLAAATWLYEETGKQIAEREALEAARTPDRGERIVHEEIAQELRMLYLKAGIPARTRTDALGARAEPLVVEATPGEE
jgi:hypothetical protein